MLPTVLVVDDDAAVCRVVAKLLRRLGFRVMTANSADDALALLDGSLPVDLVLTDQVMPGMSGVELLDRVRSRWPAMPTVLMSGVSSVCALGLLRPTLKKPFSAHELSDCVFDVLPRRSGSRQ